MSEVFDGTSITKRQPAISLDYLTAYDMGPVETGDVSEGLFARAWRIYLEEDTKIYLEAANEDNSDWSGSPELLFDASSEISEEIKEIDLTFDQLGRPFVAYEQDSRVWIWWFDPQLQETTIREVTDGRNPRCFLDERRTAFSEISDIILVYINDSSDAIEWREQRDRFNGAFTTTVTGDLSDTFVETVFKTTGNRFRIVYSEFQPTFSGYLLKAVDSELYPITIGPEEVETNVKISEGILKQIIVKRTLSEESVETSVIIESGQLRSINRDFSIEPEEIETEAVITQGDLISVVITRTIESEEIEASAVIAFGELNQIIIRETLDSEEIETEVVINSGILETP